MSLPVEQHLLESQAANISQTHFPVLDTFNDTRERTNIIIATVSLVILDCPVRQIITA